MKCEHALLTKNGVACWFCGMPRHLVEAEIVRRVGLRYNGLYRVVNLADYIENPTEHASRWLWKAQSAHLPSSPP
jgi:hypothetical protein